MPSNTRTSFTAWSLSKYRIASILYVCGFIPCRAPTHPKCSISSYVKLILLNLTLNFLRRISTVSTVAMSSDTNLCDTTYISLLYIRVYSKASTYVDIPPWNVPEPHMTPITKCEYLYYSHVVIMVHTSWLNGTKQIN